MHAKWNISCSGEWFHDLGSSDHSGTDAEPERKPHLDLISTVCCTLRHIMSDTTTFIAILVGVGTFFVAASVLIFTPFFGALTRLRANYNPLGVSFDGDAQL